MYLILRQLSTSSRLINPFIIRQPHIIRRFSNGTLNEGKSTEQKQQPQIKKPNLRQVGSADPKTKQIIIAMCILVVVYMYPMIFRPLFGFGSVADNQAEMMKKNQIDLEKHRPSFMPEWSSPFGPRKKEE